MWHSTLVWLFLSFSRMLQIGHRVWYTRKFFMFSKSRLLSKIWSIHACIKCQLRISMVHQTILGSARKTFLFTLLLKGSKRINNRYSIITIIKRTIEIRLTKIGEGQYLVLILKKRESTYQNIQMMNSVTANS